jgi:hypothetical protein
MTHTNRSQNPQPIVLPTDKLVFGRRGQFAYSRPVGDISVPPSSKTIGLHPPEQRLKRRYSFCSLPKLSPPKPVQQYHKQLQHNLAYSPKKPPIPWKPPLPPISILDTQYFEEDISSSEEEQFADERRRLPPTIHKPNVLVPSPNCKNECDSQLPRSPHLTDEDEEDLYSLYSSSEEEEDGAQDLCPVGNQPNDQPIPLSNGQSDSDEVEIDYTTPLNPTIPSQSLSDLDEANPHTPLNPTIPSQSLSDLDSKEHDSNNPTIPSQSLEDPGVCTPTTQVDTINEAPTQEEEDDIQTQPTQWSPIPATWIEDVSSTSDSTRVFVVQQSTKVKPVRRHAVPKDAVRAASWDDVICTPPPDSRLRKRRRNRSTSPPPRGMRYKPLF